jgi:hypothetical protein
MTTKQERETGPFVRPTDQFHKYAKKFHKYAKKNRGGRYASKTSDEPFQGMLNTVKLFTFKPIQPPLKRASES